MDKYERGAVAKGYDHLLTQGLVAFVDSRWGLPRICVPTEERRADNALGVRSASVGVLALWWRRWRLRAACSLALAGRGGGEEEGTALCGAA